jgi:phthiocerol/phenolphthiocerol synthesis type-I polyketide synthase E
VADQALIAVVGMAGRFPMARNVEELWANLTSGRECLHELDDETLLANGETAERLKHPSYVRRRPLIDDMESFDARYFGMTSREAELRDPQHRLFLETCVAVLEHGGHDPVRYDGRIGVYAGVNGSRYGDLHLRPHRDLVRAVGELTVEVSTNTDYLTTFVAYKLGLRGPAMTVSTACSTSLVAIHLACQALRAGECEMAIAGGVEVEWPYGRGYIYEQGNIFPPDGRCRPFDAAAAGTVFGSGVGAVLLKRLPDALADRDTVYALVRGSAVSNDGAQKVGFTAPSVDGQAACVRAALTSAGVDPSTISYVEAHGTATTIGDPIEVRALTQAYREVGGDVGAGYCGIGSIKGNLGHLGPAAGVAGFIKAALSLHREQIPPSINYTSPNPELHLDETPFRVVHELSPWPRTDRPRRAGVSSFGIGGTNAHVVLEEAPACHEPAAPAQPELLVWSAKTQAAAEALRGRLAEGLAWTDAGLADVSYTLRAGRTAHAFRDFAVAQDAREAAEVLVAAEGGEREARRGAALVMAFPGQGAQVPRMAHGLYERDERIRQGIDACFDVLSEATGRDLRALWLEAPAAELAETAVAQPLLYTIEYVLANVLMRVTGRPLAVLGHSVGELVAGAVAGVFSFEDGLRAVAERGRLMQAMPRGAMLAVPAAPDAVEALLPEGVAVAAVNASRQVVLSGEAGRVDAAAEALREAGITSHRLRTSHGYHSPLMTGAAEEFAAFLSTLRLAVPAIPLLSAAEGRFVDEEAATPAFWAGQLTAPVRFAAAGAALFEAHPGCAILEVGPGDTLTGLLRDQPAGRASGAVVRPLLGRPEPGVAEQAAYLASLGLLWKHGLDMDWCALGPPGRRVGLPTYPFERTRHLVPMRVQPDNAHPAEDARAAPPSATEARTVPVATAAPAVATGPAQMEVTWVRQAFPVPAATDLDPAPALALLPRDRELFSVLQRAGLDPEPLARGLDREGTFAAVEELASTGRLPETVVHAMHWDEAEHEDPVAATTSLAWLAQAVQRYRARAGLRAWRLIVLTRHGADVTGGEPLVPARWMLSGLLRTLGQEVRSVSCHLVDAGPRTRAETLAAYLRDPRWPVVALRGGDAWLPALRPLDADLPRRSRLRRNGTYLVTGGLGGLGLVAARALARTGLRPRLVLAGRSATPERAAAAIAELEDRGAEVEVVAADVAVEADVRRLLERARSRFGPINGVVHAAGLPGDGFLELRSAEQIEAVLRPKVAGGELLHGLLAGERSLDFVVHYSSEAALYGLIGSSDYAAANAYLDALARRQGGGDVHVVSINWPAWAEVGMAARGAVVQSLDAAPAAPKTAPGTLVVERRLTGTEWLLDEHRIAGRPVMPGTGYLDLVLSAAAEAGVVEAGRPVQLRDLVFTAPLVVEGPTRVRVELRPAADRHLAFVKAMPASGGPWSDHAQAVLAPAAAEPGDLDLGDAHRLLQEGERLDGGAGSGLVAFGARWSNVARAARQGDVIVSELRLPSAFRGDLEGHPAHPALVDNATAVIGSVADRPHLPFLYREVVFFRPVPEAVVSVATLSAGGRDSTSADIDLYDVRGRHVARIRGYTMRAVDPESVDRSIRDDRPGGADGGPGEGDERRLTPAEGAAVLLRVIECDVPGQVFVRAPGTSVEVPGHVMLRDGVAQAAPVATAAVPVPAPAPAAAPPPAASPPPPNGSRAEQLTALFVEVLGDARIGPDDDFFSLGGSSLTGVQLVSRIRDTFGVELSVGVLFEKGTVRGLGDELAKLLG